VSTLGAQAADVAGENVKAVNSRLDRSDRSRAQRGLIHGLARTFSQSSDR